MKCALIGAAERRTLLCHTYPRPLTPSLLSQDGQEPVRCSVPASALAQQRDGPLYAPDYPHPLTLSLSTHRIARSQCGTASPPLPRHSSAMAPCMPPTTLTLSLSLSQLTG